MPPPTRHITLTDEQDLQLHQLEQSPFVKIKVRLRATIIRLNAVGWTVPDISEHHRRNQQSIHNDLDRFEQAGIAGLTDGTSSGRPGKFTPEIEMFLKVQLELDRVWNTNLLSQEIFKVFKVKLKREAIRVKMLDLGYTWKRTRYSPGKTPDPALVAASSAELEALKKGHWTKD